MGKTLKVFFRRWQSAGLFFHCQGSLAVPQGGVDAANIALKLGRPAEANRSSVGQSSVQRK